MPISNPPVFKSWEFVELVGSEDYHPVGVGWEAWDISAIVPAGTHYVLVGIGAAGAGRTAGARENNTLLERKDVIVPGTASTRWTLMLLTQCDGSRIIEVYASLVAEVYFAILGYWRLV